METPQQPDKQPLTLADYHRLEKEKRDAKLAKRAKQFDRWFGLIVLLAGSFLVYFAYLLFTGSLGWGSNGVGLASLIITYVASQLNQNASLSFTLKGIAWTIAIAIFVGHIFKAGWVMYTAAVLVGIIGIVLVGYGIWQMLFGDD